MAHAYGDGDKPIPGYRLVKFLGRGGFGQVWQASAPGGTRVALKIIDLEGKQGLKEFRAVRLMRNVVHPNLVPIMAFWLKDDQGTILDGTMGDDADSFTFLKSKAAELLIAMGLGEKNLLDRLKECQREGQKGIPVEELLEYLEAAAKAIDYLNRPVHEMGAGRPVAIPHTDVKPQNILIVGGGIQMCDFGLVREMEGSRSTSPSASIAYTPPEFLDGRASPSMDQYSLAVTYVELRTGSLPFTSDNPAAMVYAHLQGRLDLSRLPPAERRVVQKATSLEPKDRYKSAQEMVRALRDCLADSQARRADDKESPGAAELLPGREIVPGYRLSKSLGSGSYGVVWEVTGPGGTRLAFKIIRDLDQAAGQQEYKALELIKGIEHKYLMETFAYWLLDSSGRVIRDEMRGQANAPKPATLVVGTKLARKNLGQRLKECQSSGQSGIPLEELLRYIDQSAKALDYLNSPKHKSGDKYVAIQHRDIKPENILLTANDDVKIADFGLAKVVEGLSTVIHTRSMGLTPYYAAPEMFEERITKWTDQYCLAVTYCHLRTGVLPFERINSVQDIMRAHLLGKLDLSHLPPGERQVIMKATAVKPDERFATCSEMAAALIAVCQDSLTSPLEESFFGAQPPAPARKNLSEPGSTKEIATRGKRPATPGSPKSKSASDESMATMSAAPGTLSAPPSRNLAESADEGLTPAMPEANEAQRPRMSPLRPVSAAFAGLARFAKKCTTALRQAREAVMGTAAPQVTDQVHFSVTAPAVLLAGKSYILDVWAHLAEQRQQVLERAREAQGGKDVLIRSKGGIAVARGTTLAVRVVIPDFLVDDAENVINWNGEIGNATFPFRVPKETAPGSYNGGVSVRVGGLEIAKLHFSLEVGKREAPPHHLGVTERLFRRAFASYATPDRDAVLARVQGIQKVIPHLDIFLDVASLRSGQRWSEQLVKEITERDVFYLFWSAHARDSTWVRHEWQTALRVRGIDFIDPVPLESPEEVPPPPELAGDLHFNDWVLAYMRGRR